MNHVTTLHDTPSGDAETVSFEVWDHPFLAISAGPLFRFNPSISFMVNFDPSRDKNARELLDTIWERLSEGGRALMPIDKYDFSERYGWIEDKYGLSWQLILSDPEGDPRPAIMLEDQWFTAMESAQDHRFDFNEAVSLMVRCETQEDIDYYWNRLSAVPEAE